MLARRMVLHQYIQTNKNWIVIYPLDKVIRSLNNQPDPGERENRDMPGTCLVKVKGLSARCGIFRQSSLLNFTHTKTTGLLALLCTVLQTCL